MATETTLKSRLIHCAKTTAQWSTNGTKVGKKGELLLEIIDTNHFKVKVGDGVTGYSSLPFMGEKWGDVIKIYNLTNTLTDTTKIANGDTLEQAMQKIQANLNTLNNKVYVTYSDTTPNAPTASGSAGTSTKVSRGDHAHPKQQDSYIKNDANAAGGEDYRLVLIDTTTGTATFASLTGSASNLKYDGLKLTATLSGETTWGGHSVSNFAKLTGGKISLSVIPDSVLGQLEYIGTWDATAGKAVSDTRPLEGEVIRAYRKGDYYIVKTAGTKLPDTKTITELDGLQIGDWIVYNGTTWDKIDNTDYIKTVAGITPTNGDISIATLVTELNKQSLIATTLKNARTFSLSGDVTATGQSFDGSANVVLSTTIADNAVTTTKIKDANVTTEKLADGAVTTEKLNNNFYNFLEGEIGNKVTDLKSELNTKLTELDKKIVPFYLEQERTFTTSNQDKIYFNNLNLKGGEYFLKFRIESNDAVWSRLALFTNNVWNKNVDKWDYLSNNTEYIKENVNDIQSLSLFLLTAQQVGTIKVTLKIYNKLADGVVTTPKVADGAITNTKIANYAITSEKIINNSVDIEKISFKDEIRSANRCDPSACVYGYINMNTGALVTNINTRYASDFIPVSTKGLYCYGISGYGKIGGNAVYDVAKNFLRGFKDNVYNYQDGDAYVRWTLATNAVETPSVYVIEGTSLGSYTPFVPTKFIIKSEYLPVLGKEYLPALSLCGKDSIVASSDTIAAGTSLQLDNFPQYLKGNGIVSFSGNLTSFDEMSVGFGTSTNSIAVKVDATNVHIIKSGSQLGSAIAHGLNISDFINITFENSLAAPKIVLSTIDGLFVHTMSPLASLESYGLPVATMGAGTIVTNAILRATSNRFNKPIWVCGDSYTSLYDERWTKQMINTIGEDNFLLIGLAGGSSGQIYSDLNKALAFGTPKFLIWCLGMNDTYANWLKTFESLKTLCSQNGIELILQTIPIPNLSTSSNQEQINNVIKASGYRYVDAALAMSPNSSYPWYDGYNDDGVHPTVLGAKVMASRFLSDFPEFMQ